MTGSLRRRLERLEALEGPRERDEDAERRAWIATARVRRVHENRDRDEYHAGDIFRLLRNRGEMEGATYEAARDRILAWRPPPARWAVERILSGMAHEGEPGTENMACPPEWREAWEAADELRERHEAVPVETFARWVSAQHGHEAEGGEGDAPRIRVECESHGITNELFLRAAGPDAAEVGEDEQARRLRKILADLYYGERAWEVQQEIYRLTEQRNDNG